MHNDDEFATELAPVRLNIESADVAGGVRLVVDGEVDVATARQLAKAIEAALAEHRRVELDLSGVTFMDSSGLGALTEPAAAVERRLVLAAASTPVERLLDVTGLKKGFDPVTAPIDYGVDGIQAELDRALAELNDALDQNDAAAFDAGPKPYGAGALQVLSRRVEQAEEALAAARASQAQAS